MVGRPHKELVKNGYMVYMQIDGRSKENLKDAEVVLKIESNSINNI